MSLLLVSWVLQYMDKGIRISRGRFASAQQDVVKRHEEE